MATTISNTATATYSYTSGGEQNISSNTISTNLILDYAISGNIISNNSTFRPGENLTFQVIVKNDGTEPLYNVTITDALTRATEIFSYLPDSATVNMGNAVTPISPTNLDPLKFVLPGVLNADEISTLTFVVSVNDTIPSGVSSLTSTVTISANEGSSTGDLISVSPNPSITIYLADYANLTMTKEVSSMSISEGEPFYYTLNLENSGNIEATGVVITDVLPTGFSITSITSMSEGVQKTYLADEYSVDSSTNTLTLPVGSTSISVPAATGGVYGNVTITINGVIN